MKKIALLMGSEKIKKYPTTAKMMYWESHIFRATYKYAQIVADEVYILSPKYGVVGVDEVIGVEDENLEEWSTIKRQKWAKNILIELAEKTNLQEDNFEIIMEKNYYEFILQGLENYRIPLKNRSKAEWLPCLYKLIGEEYNRFRHLDDRLISGREIHRLVQALPKYNYLTIDEIPFEEGVYFIIDKNEIFDEYPRIVRVGTHKGDGRLKKRLKQHFMTEDKNGSILRKYIGGALLSQKKDEYLETWKYNSRDHEVYKKCKSHININKERAIEAEVSKYLRECTSFCCINIKKCDERLKFKENVLRSLYEDESFKPTDDWLGKSSPMLHIGVYGLWNEQLRRKELGE